MPIIDRYAALVVDLDGVVFSGGELVRGASTYLRRSRRQRPPTVFVTNNSSRTPQEWSELFERSKVDVPVDRILTSATATAALLARSGRHAVYVLGEFGLRSSLRDAGLEVVDDASRAATVVVGWDRTLTWEKLRDAARAVSRGARFVATNPDPRVPTPDGPVPGNGATLAFLREATGAAPEVVGKPRTGLLEHAAELLGVDGDVLMVGDQVRTDVAGARAMGWDAALVRSGIDDWRDLVTAPVLPRWVVDDIAALDGPEPPSVRGAREADLSQVRTLLERAGFDAAGAAARLPTTLVAEGDDGVVLGTVAWEILGSAAHLRGITVSEGERGLGVGSHLVTTALHHLRGSGVEWAYLLTPGADALFEDLGFWRVHRDRVPEEVLATAQYGGPASGGTALVRRLQAA